MAQKNELEVLTEIDSGLSELDSDAKERVLAFVWQKHSQKPVPGSGAADEGAAASKKKNRKTKPAGAVRQARRASKGPTLVKTLNLRPSNKESFSDFVVAKNPTNNEEKATVAVYYLRETIELPDISIDHVFTCFKEMKDTWRMPSDLVNTVQQAASREGWLDSKKSDDIQLTARGENLVRHDLPKSKETKK